MCKGMPLHYWLMQYLLFNCFDGSKNKMADMLPVDRQTLGRAFRRAEKENARITPAVSEQMTLYLFEHKTVLDKAVVEYSEEMGNACSQIRTSGELTNHSGAKMGSVPQYPEAVLILEVLKQAMHGKKQNTHVAACYKDHYCGMYESCPVRQLLGMYDAYLTGHATAPMNKKRGDSNDV